jgi:T-complex protein 1 subunit beta
MDTDKIKIFGARIKVEGTSKLAELERAEKARRVSIRPLRTNGVRDRRKR